MVGRQAEMYDIQGFLEVLCAFIIHVVSELGRVMHVLSEGLLEVLA